MVGVLLGMHLVKQCTVHPDSIRMNEGDFFERLGPWDGVWYRQIATKGYSYDADKMSSVAFYPLYPLLGRLVFVVTGLPVQQAFAVLSHLALAGTFGLLTIYMYGGSEVRIRCTDYTLIALGLFPTSFYLRMSYTESTFMFFSMLVFVGMQRRWPSILLAVVIGAATATRPVGIALIPPFLWYLRLLDEKFLHRLTRIAVLLPLCVWGILGYMAYQYCVFGDALAFTRTQIHWYERMPPEGMRGLLSLATFEPIRDVFDPSSQCYWAKVPPYNLPLFNMHFMNPILVLTTWSCIAFGWWKRWIDVYELLFCIGILMIPYITHAYRGCMCSNARYALIAFPQFIVYGRLLSSISPGAATILTSLSSILLAFYSALFVSWYWFY